MTTNGQLTIIETGALVATEVFKPGGIEALLAALEAEVLGVPTDISTEKGRKAVASLAYKVARSKTAIDDLGKGLVEGVKKQVKLIDEDRKIARDRLDALRDRVRKPLDDYEAAEAARIAAHETAVARLAAIGQGLDGMTAAQISDRLESLGEFSAPQYQEFSQRAEAAYVASKSALVAAYDAAIKREAEAAKLARLRAEAEARARAEAAEQALREQAEREARIAREATEKAEAAAREAAERAARKAAAEMERAAREKAEAERRAAQAEAAAKAQAEQAARDLAATKERAAQQERDRIAAEAAAREAATAAREKDQNHRRAVNAAALADLVKAGLTEDAAKAAITAIAKGQVAHISISY